MNNPIEMAKNQTEHKVIMLDVNNHPGVLSHITGLFSRRGFNLEAVMCGKIKNGATSRMYLLVENNEKLDQVVLQLDKLYDVRYVTVCESCDSSVFDNVQKIIGDSSEVL